jgi:uncharacterized membrane protein HdeD (DUF308 family)
MQPILPGDEQDFLRRNWPWLLALGILQILFGLVALSMKVLATEVAVEFYGFLLLASGISAGLHSFVSRRLPTFLLLMLTFVLNIIVGVFMITETLRAAIALTLLLAIFFMVSGLFRFFGALFQRFPNWPWVMLGGLITFLLGWLVYLNWPLDSFVFIGLYIGIDLIFTGWGWVAFALTARAQQPITPAAP